jgi:hypothetical protein
LPVLDDDSVDGERSLRASEPGVDGPPGLSLSERVRECALLPPPLPPLPPRSSNTPMSPTDCRILRLLALDSDSASRCSGERTMSFFSDASFFVLLSDAPLSSGPLLFCVRDQSVQLALREVD